MSEKSAENMTLNDLWHQLTRLNDWLKANMPDASVVCEGDTATATLWALDKLQAENARLTMIRDLATVWEATDASNNSVERARWLLLGQLAHKTLEGKKP